MFVRLTPRLILRLARVGAAVCAGLLVLLMLGPFQGLEQAFGLSDKAAHAVAFFAATTGLFLIAPTWRRGDIAAGATVFAVLIEVIQGLTGRSASITDVMADLLGIGVALLPGMIERFRWMAQAHPDLTLGEIGARDRRRGRALKAGQTQTRGT